MKEDEDIETMFSRFKTLVNDLQVLNKSYIVRDHVKNILRSLPAMETRGYYHSVSKGPEQT